MYHCVTLGVTSLTSKRERALWEITKGVTSLIVCIPQGLVASCSHCLEMLVYFAGLKRFWALTWQWEKECKIGGQCACNCEEEETRQQSHCWAELDYMCMMCQNEMVKKQEHNSSVVFDLHNWQTNCPLPKTLTKLDLWWKKQMEKHSTLKKSVCGKPMWGDLIAKLDSTVIEKLSQQSKWILFYLDLFYWFIWFQIAFLYFIFRMQPKHRKPSFKKK